MPEDLVDGHLADLDVLGLGEAANRDSARASAVDHHRYSAAESGEAFVGQVRDVEAGLGAAHAVPDLLAGYAFACRGERLVLGNLERRQRAPVHAHDRNDLAIGVGHGNHGRLVPLGRLGDDEPDRTRCFGLTNGPDLVHDHDFRCADVGR